MLYVGLCYYINRSCFFSHIVWLRQLQLIAEYPYFSNYCRQAWHLSHGLVEISHNFKTPIHQINPREATSGPWCRLLNTVENHWLVIPGQAAVVFDSEMAIVLLAHLTAEPSSLTPCLSCSKHLWGVIKNAWPVDLVHSTLWLADLSL